MSELPATLEDLRARIPSEVLVRSGRVFYSGRNAFTSPAQLYVLGLNPGGDPSRRMTDTVENHTASVLHEFPADWSAYRDESWEGAVPGTWGMQPRVLHLFVALGFNPSRVPCSNLLFVRSRREVDISGEMRRLADLCWQFHSFAIDLLRPRAILCFGKTAGQYVRGKLGAKTQYDEFVERNNRKWRSRAFVSSAGLKVVVATHPGIADWAASSTDPTQLVREAVK